ncbi:MAG: HAD family hydrolase [Leptospiraceae bacterium]|nr:HAD family hydrolase [Leptospiraceae bacterium]
MKYPHNFQPKFIRAIAFDIDGTLFSSESIILDTYILAFQNYEKQSGKKIRIPTKDEIMAQVGKPVKSIFSNLVPELSESIRDQISDSILELLCEKILSGEGEIYPEVKETILALKSNGLKLLCASNGRMPYVSSILARIGVLEEFEEILVLNYRERKTKADILGQYHGKYRLEPGSILMVGDRASDFDAAMENSAPFAFCEYGHASRDEVTSYNILLKKPSDLLKFFTVV